MRNVKIELISGKFQISFLFNEAVWHTIMSYTIAGDIETWIILWALEGKHPSFHYR